MKATIAVFAKAPRPGHVKTRLQPALSARQASKLYEASLRDVIAKLDGLPAEVRIAYDPTPPAAEFFAAEFPHLPRNPQVDGDLGDRLEAAFDQLFRDAFQTVTIIGADSPTLPNPYLESALAALNDVDAAFGPTADGGYYLVGLNRRSWPAASSIFRNIPWSTKNVLSTSLDRASLAKLAYRLLPAWYDIDVPSDLLRAQHDASPESHLGRWFHSNYDSPQRP